MLIFYLYQIIKMTLFFNNYPVLPHKIYLYFKLQGYL